MRPARFEPFMKDLVEQSMATGDAPAVAGVATFREIGYDIPSGLRFTLTTGASVYVQFVHGAPRGGSPVDEPERIIEGEPPAQVPGVRVELHGGKVPMVSLEQWLAALVINSQSRELASLERYSTRDQSRRGFHQYGLTILWHSTGEAYAYVRHTLPAGETARPQTDWKILESV